MAKLSMMCGYPRSGKSTWIKKNKGTRLVIEPDWVRREILGHTFHQPAEPIIWLIADSFIRVCLSQNQDVILDGINLQPFIRSKYIHLAQSLDCKIECIWVDTPIDECIRRNEESDINNKLPTSILIGKQSVFVTPKLEEGFSSITIIHTGETCKK